nr:hypothetical protein [Enterocloster clostridioformis]
MGVTIDTLRNWELNGLFFHQKDGQRPSGP